MIEGTMRHDDTTTVSQTTYVGYCMRTEHCQVRDEAVFQNSEMNQIHEKWSATLRAGCNKNPAPESKGDLVTN